MTPFRTFTHASCAALISSRVNIRVCELVLVPQVGSGRYDLRGGGGGGASSALTMWMYSSIGIMLRGSGKVKKQRNGGYKDRCADRSLPCSPVKEGVSSGM